MRLLCASQLSLLLVTHDRYFLERTCGDILELDNAAVHSYKTDGSYDTFLRRRAERLAADDADFFEAAKPQQSIKREGFDEDGGGGAGPGPVRLDGDDDEPDDDSGDLDDLDDLLG